LSDAGLGVAMAMLSRRGIRNANSEFANFQRLGNRGKLP
jgi:hypothetical protein